MESKSLRELLLEAQIALGEAVRKLEESGGSGGAQQESSLDLPVSSTAGSGGASLASSLAGLDIERIIGARRGVGALAGGPDTRRAGVNVACDEGCAVPANLTMQARGVY
jgi:hypothetical protein